MPSFPATLCFALFDIPIWNDLLSMVLFTSSSETLLIVICSQVNDTTNVCYNLSLDRLPEHITTQIS